MHRGLSVFSEELLRWASGPPFRTELVFEGAEPRTQQRRCSEKTPIETRHMLTVHFLDAPPMSSPMITPSSLPAKELFGRILQSKDLSRNVNAANFQARLTPCMSAGRFSQALSRENVRHS